MEKEKQARPGAGEHSPLDREGWSNRQFPLRGDRDKNIVVCEHGKKLVHVPAKLTDEGGSTNQFLHLVVVLELELTEVVKQTRAIISSLLLLLDKFSQREGQPISQKYRRRGTREAESHLTLSDRNITDPSKEGMEIMPEEVDEGTGKNDMKSVPREAPAERA